MISSAVIIACLMHGTATTAVFFKANSKILFGVDMHPLAWWLLTGWFLEIFYLNAFWNLAEATNPWVAQITLAAVGTLVSLAWMSAFYGFSLKYIAAALLVCAGVVVSRL